MHLYTYVYMYKKVLIYVIFIKKTLTVNESCQMEIYAVYFI